MSIIYFKMVLDQIRGTVRRGTEKKQLTRNFKYKCVVSDELLGRMLNGAINRKN